MSAPVVEADKRGFRAPGTGFMVAGALIGAVGAYLFQVYGGRSLGPAAFAPVSVLWTAFFILATVLLVPVEQYVTREVASGRRAIPHDLKPTFVMAAIGAAVGGVFVFATLDDLFEGDLQYVVQIVLLMVGYSLLFAGKGVLAGTRHFGQVGWVLVIETSARLLAGIIAIQLLATATSLGWAMVVGGIAVLAMKWWRYDKGESKERSAPAGGFLAGYVGGTTSSQLLLGGAPIAVAALGASPALISIVFVTFTLFRAPLTLIFALQGRVLPYLVGLAREANRAQLARIARLAVFGGAGLALLGALLGWLVGADVVALLFGEEFAPTAIVAMLAAGGVTAAAAAQIASQVLVAEARTRRLSFAWLGGLAAGVLALVLLRVEPDTRVALSFAIGEFVALGLMAVLATRR
ncbi:MAG: lipopolysaccharide biosynthesis protein [Acidimicrobiia bacterium]